MQYLSVSEVARKWNISERSVRNYCALGRVDGAMLVGKTWSIPSDAIKPDRANGKNNTDNELLNVLRREKASRLKGGIYHRTQVQLTFNSNHIEGSRLTEDQTRFIFETNTIGVGNDSISVDDVIETTNHFKCIDFIIDNAKEPLSEKMIKRLHYMLKVGTSDSDKDWFMVGDYKKLPNEVGGNETCPPENVKIEIANLIEQYTDIENKELKDIINFHFQFESIHPFQDGNGRIGRLIMFKECLNNNIVPFIITNDLKMFYYRGLKEWQNVKGYLMDTILTAQDLYKKYLDYFKIKY